MSANVATQDPRTATQALKRGLLCRCPACGDGSLFARYLKVADQCTNCGEELHHHRADDFPPYLTIFIVGHLFVPLALMVEVAYLWPTWLHLLVWCPLTIVLTLLLLPPLKGGVVGLQWAHRMHGFGGGAK